MANAQSTNPSSEQPGRQPMPAGKRRRLQQCFEQGAKVASKGEFDYATEMYSICVKEDSGNPLYVKSFLTNLKKKYNNNKKGAAFAGMKTAGTKASIKKSAMQKDWQTVINTGLEVLKINPWDSGTLIEVGRACEMLEFDECQLEYVRLALDADPADVEVNRVAARALGRTGNFDEAIVCWQRVSKAKPGDEEAHRAVGNLSVEKTIQKGGYEGAESTKQVRVNKASADDAEDKRLTPIQQLERAIKKKPGDVEKYIELSDLHQREEDFAAAEAVLARALEASGGNVQIRERLEDVELRRARQQLEVAEQKFKAEKTEAAEKLLKDMKHDLVSKEIQIYAARCERYPADLAFKFELATRLEKGKKFAEAIKLFQEARGDLKHKGQILMGLGRCFTHIKQYKLALSHFQQAVEAIPQREVEQSKEALYMAGKLAVHLKDLEAAEKHLAALAGLDFAYKDVSEWLDKLAKLREDGPQSAED
jgi:tetratricopeptide (TPR) repeat protein